MAEKTVGLYVCGEPKGGGSWQYIQFLMDALYYIKDKYNTMLIFSDNQQLWESKADQYGFATYYADKKVAKLRNMHHIFDDLGCSIIIDGVQNDTCAYIDTPVIAIEHDLMHRYENFPEIGDTYNARENMYKRMGKYAAGIFVDSDMGKSQYLDCYGSKYADKIYVMPFRVPDYLLDDLGSTRKDLGHYIFYPAQFWKHKNHEGLIRAAYKLRESEGIEIKLLFVGSEKNNLGEIMNIIKELHMENQVDIKGYVSDDEMRSLYDGARAMMMASFCGPTNIPPLEAMYTGCPCAVSDVYAMPWQVADAGLTFDPGSVDSIAFVMKQLWTDDELCRSLAKKGKERVKQFSRECFNKRFSEAVDDILKKKGDNRVTQTQKITRIGSVIKKYWEIYVCKC